MPNVPDGNWIDPSEVRGLTLLGGLKHGPRVRVDVAGPISCHLIEFDDMEAARAWRDDFAMKVNGTPNPQPARRA